MQLCVDVPSPEIIHTGSWLNQTAGLGSDSSPIPLYKFPSTGQYRISASLEGVCSSGNPAVYLTFWPSYTGTADQVMVLTACPSFKRSSGGVVFPLVVSSEQECNFYTRIAGSVLDHYNLYFTIEKLQ